MQLFLFDVEEKKKKKQQRVKKPVSSFKVLELFPIELFTKSVSVTSPIVVEKKKRKKKPQTIDLFNENIEKKENQTKEKKQKKRNYKEEPIEEPEEPIVFGSEYSFCDSGDYERLKHIESKRIRQMKIQPTVLAMLAEGWTTTNEVAHVVGCTYRAAKNLLRWARVHYFVEQTEEDKYDDDCEIDGIEMSTQGRVGTKFRLINGSRMKRFIRLAPCKYTCCADFKLPKEVIIADYGHAKHMFRSTVDELNSRSAVSVGPMWILIGDNPPPEPVSESEAISWVMSSHLQEFDPYDETHYDNKKIHATVRQMGNSIVPASKNRRRDVES